MTQGKGERREVSDQSLALSSVYWEGTGEKSAGGIDTVARAFGIV